MVGPCGLNQSQVGGRIGDGRSGERGRIGLRVQEGNGRQIERKAYSMVVCSKWDVRFGAACR